MAKTSMVEREKRREKLVKQYAAKRAKLKETIRSPKSTDAEREEATRKLQSLPRDTAALAACATAARSPVARAAYTASLASARTKLREATMRGDVPGPAQGQLVSGADWRIT